MNRTIGTKNTSALNVNVANVMQNVIGTIQRTKVSRAKAAIRVLTETGSISGAFASRSENRASRMKPLSPFG
jgi:hypothetical protein